jgi:hypothetical protein
MKVVPGSHKGTSFCVLHIALSLVHSAAGILHVGTEPFTVNELISSQSNHHVQLEVKRLR